MAVAYLRLGWLQATCPDEKYRDAKKAFENANKGYQLNLGKDWGYINALAAAYAENKDFETAREWQAKAIKMAEADKNTSEKDKKELYDEMEFFKQNKPYRDELKP